MDNKEIIEDVTEIVARLVDTKREFGSFSLEFTGTLDVKITAISGWSVTYPYGNETWVILANWADRWDDESIKSIENFIKVLVYPTSVRLLDVDEEYLNDILRAHINLTSRTIKNGDGDE